MPTQYVNGTTYAYSERGSGPVLVLLHGFPLDGRVWEDQLADLSDRYRVIAPDLRGFGRSTGDAPFTIESLADDVHALLAAIGARPAVLGGLSMGGYVALAYARKYPGDLRGLVLLDTKAEPDTPDGKVGRQQMIDLVRASGAAAVADRMMPKLVAAGAAAARPAAVAKLRAIMEAVPPTTIEHALAAMRDRPDRSAELAAIAVPTLVVVGEADAITPPAVAEATRAAIPRATLAVIEGSGHMTPMEEPARVNTALRRFMETL